jgi:hypothetical protein
MANLEKKIEQWKGLKAMRKTLDERLDVLRKQILADIGEGPVYGVQKQVRDHTSLNEEAAWEILAQACGLENLDMEAYSKRVLDPDKIEGLYLEGILTDTDLRLMREPKYVEALVEVKEDVQTID